MTLQRILILTDLHWTDPSKKITNKDITALKSLAIPDKPKFSKIKEYVDIVDKHNPTLILFGGDVTGDGSCGHGYHLAFLYLLQYLEIRKVKSVFIRGNHDLEPYYSKLVKGSSKCKYTAEISGRSHTINGLKILGLSYVDTNNKTKLLTEIKKNNEYDILLAHAELTRRPWLFDFNAKYIITGHYDVKFSFINGKVFLSFFNDYPDRSYATIDIQQKKELISYYLKPSYTIVGYPASEIFVQGKKQNNTFSFLNKKKLFSNHYHKQSYYDDILGLEFKTGFEELAKSKKRFVERSIKLTKLQLDGLTSYRVNNFMKISKTLIHDYFGTSGLEK